ncbi:protein CROWDED NUCLEI 4-like [Dendronephthya gigantea]|uniref:protein CROWDED NUCLEI 4-like n=1 Tax=Dendronephthya gigantea TaxID=151771 RepID=UPI00106CEB2C|nr:protein CROWDED NUCLEI 4-like [Dendronephthya gigantea]
MAQNQDSPLDEQSEALDNPGVETNEKIHKCLKARKKAFKTRAFPVHTRYLTKKKQHNSTVFDTEAGSSRRRVPETRDERTTDKPHVMEAQGADGTMGTSGTVVYVPQEQQQRHQQELPCEEHALNERLNGVVGEITNRDLDTRMVEKEAEVTERETVVTKRETVVTKREAEVTERETGIAKREANAANRDEIIASRETTVAERETAIAEREATVAERETTVAEQQIMVAELVEYTQRVIAERDVANAQLVPLNDLLDQVRTSFNILRSLLYVNPHAARSSPSRPSPPPRLTVGEIQNKHFTVQPQIKVVRKNASGLSARGSSYEPRNKQDLLIEMDATKSSSVCCSVKMPLRDSEDVKERKEQQQLLKAKVEQTLVLVEEVKEKMARIKKIFEMLEALKATQRQKGEIDKERMATMEKEMDDFKKKMVSMEKTIRELHKKLKESEEKRIAKQSELAKMDEENTFLKEKVDKLEASERDLQCERQVDKEELNAMAESLYDLEKKIDSQKEAITQLQRRYNEKMVELVVLRLQCQQKDTRIGEERTRANNLQDYNDVLQQLLGRFEERIVHFESHEQDARDLQDELQQIIGGLREWIVRHHEPVEPPESPVVPEPSAPFFGDGNENETILVIIFPRYI